MQRREGRSKRKKEEKAEEGGEEEEAQRKEVEMKTFVDRRTIEKKEKSQN